MSCLLFGLKLAQSSYNFYNLVVTLCTTKFNIQNVCLLQTQCIYGFRVDLRTKSDCLHIIN